MKRVLAVLVIALLAMSFAASAQGYANGYSDGRAEGWENCDANLHRSWGFAFGVFYVGYCLIDPPDGIPDEALNKISAETNEYQEGYVLGYEKGWQSRRMSTSVTGAAVGALVSYLLLSVVLGAY